MDFIIYNKSKAERRKAERKAERRQVVAKEMSEACKREVKAHAKKDFGEHGPALVRK